MILFPIIKRYLNVIKERSITWPFHRFRKLMDIWKRLVLTWSSSRSWRSQSKKSCIQIQRIRVVFPAVTSSSNVKVIRHWVNIFRVLGKLKPTPKKPPNSTLHLGKGNLVILHCADRRTATKIFTPSSVQDPLPSLFTNQHVRARLKYSS